MSKERAKWAWIRLRVRTWTAWYRFITLALLAHAFLVVMQLQGREAEQKRGSIFGNYVH